MHYARGDRAGRPSIIAHRGACAALPEHTLAAFELALDQGADAIELDLVASRDGTLIVRHDLELSATTDVADRPEFRDRWRTATIDGLQADGWFAEDFAAAELHRLRARQRFAFRSRAHDGRYPVPTLDEVLDLAAARSAARGQRVGVFLELKHASHHDDLGLPLDEVLVRTLARRGLDQPDSGIIAQAFEVTILQRLHARTALPLVQLLDVPPGMPFDQQRAAQTPGTAPIKYADMIAPAGLARIACYAHAIGPCKRLIVPAMHAQLPDDEMMTGRLAPPTRLIDDAHAAGLRVYAWTFRDEPRFLAAEYEGDPARELLQFAALGVDGIITDQPATAVSARIH